MNTDAGQLMHYGVQTGVETFAEFLAELAWTHDDLDRSICHQVGVRHRAAMLEAMNLPLEKDSVSYPQLGNTGSVALPLTLAKTANAEHLNSGDRVALLGIGYVCVASGAPWTESRSVPSNQAT